MNTLDRTVDIHCVIFVFNYVFTRSERCRVSWYQDIKVVGEKLVEHLQVCVHIHRQIEIHKRHVSRGKCIDRHQDPFIRQIDKQIPFI